MATQEIKRKIKDYFVEITEDKFTKVKTTDQYPYHINSGYNMIIDEKEFKDFINIICK